VDDGKNSAIERLPRENRSEHQRVTAMAPGANALIIYPNTDAGETESLQTLFSTTKTNRSTESEHLPFYSGVRVVRRLIRHVNYRRNRSNNRLRC